MTDGSGGSGDAGPGGGLPGGSRPPGARRRPAAPSAQERLLRQIAAGRRARQQRTLLALVSAASALVLAASGAAWGVTSYLTAHLSRLGAGTTGTPASGPLNILVAGVDIRAGLTERQKAELHVGNDISDNSDSLMLVHVPASHDYMQVVSLPRDSWVNIPGHGLNKINAAIGLGGPKLMVQTVAAATGLTINDYVEVNFLGFVKVVDALGGVNICLPFAVNDAYSGLDLPAGLHHVDGVTALEFARDRHSFAASDLARIDNQQQLLATMMEKAVSTGTLSNPFRLQQVIDSVTASIQVDQGFNLLRLAGQLRGIRPQDVVFDTVPLASTNYLTPGGESAVLWDGPAASQLWTQIRDDQRPAALPAPAPRHAAKSGKAGAKAPAPSQPPPADGQPGQPAAGGQEKTAAQDACH
jgi:LCP family protein required for cell wall assembly